MSVVRESHHSVIMMDVENTDDETLVKDTYIYIARKMYPDGCTSKTDKEEILEV